MRILLIDDCVDTGEVVRFSLRPLQVDHALSFSEARHAIVKTPYALLLIDVTLPDGSGFDFCREIAAEKIFRSIPKILLTALNSTADKVFGLNCGADDYITKPFIPAELKARVDAKLRLYENTAHGDAIFRKGDFEFNQEFQSCHVVEGDARTNLQLTPTEFRIFLGLARAEGATLSREDIVKLLRETPGYHIEPRGIDSHIRHLRKKLGAYSARVISVYGRGYAYVSSDQVKRVA